MDMTDEEAWGQPHQNKLMTDEEAWTPAPVQEAVNKKNSEWMGSAFLSGFKYGSGEYEGLGFGLVDPGMGLSKDTLSWLRNSNFYKNQGVLNQAFVDQVFVPAAITAKAALKGGDIFLRTIGGSITGTLFAAGKGLEEKGFPQGEKLGQEIGAYFLESPVIGGFAHEAPIARARANNVIGVPEAVWSGVKEPTPEQAAVQSRFSAQMPPERPDIHTAVRQAQPELFSNYDRLEATRDNLRDQISELNTQRTADIDAKIAEIQEAKKGGYGKLKSLEEKRQKILETDTPEMAELRKKLQDTDYQMRDLAPKVSEAYRNERVNYPEEVPEEPKAEVKAEQPPVKPAEEQTRFIASDMAQKLQEAGRPAEEANAASQIVAEHYRARSERFGGKLGTAEEMYGRDMAEIRAGRGSLKPTEFAQGENKGWIGRLWDKIRGQEETPNLDNASLEAGRPYSQTRPTVEPGTQESLRQTSEANPPSGVFTTRAKTPSTIEGGVSISGASDIGISYHNVSDLESLRKLASESEADLHNLLKYIGENTEGAEFAGVRLKDEGSLGFKLKNLEPKEISDYLGGRIIVDNARALRDVIEKIKSYGNVLSVDDYISDPSPLGYRSIHIQIMGENGISAEIQVQPRAMSEIAREQHGLYKKWQQKISAGDVEEALKAKEESRRLYDDAWKKWEGNDLYQGARGKIRPSTENAKAIITLMKKADASTFIHETGHHWLNELLADAKHELAPEDLIRDSQTVRKWLGAEEGAEITRRQHEKFARGFERYMMEGVAPSKQLASVFAKFRDWLMDIYQTVQKLRAPITNDIRDVFDRLLSSNPEKTTIASEKEPGRSLADIHETDAKTTKPEHASAARDTIRSEVDQTAKTHDKEIYDGLRSSEKAGGIPEEAAVSSGTGEPTAGLPSPVSAEKPSAVNAGRGEPGGIGSATPEGPNDIIQRSDLVDKAGNIRLDNLKTPEDINRVLRETASANGDFMGLRRGIITDSQVLDLADALGMDAKYLDTRRIGEAFNAEQIVAARKLLIQSATDVRDAMQKAANGSEADILAYAEAKTKHQMIQGHVSGITAEAGRALRAFRALEGSREAKLLGDFLQSATGQTLFQLQEEARLGSKLDTAQKISKFINDSKKPTFVDMALEYWVNALLSGPITHMKNILGNTITALASIPETAVASAISKVRGAEEGVQFGEARARLFGIAQGAKEGIRTAWESFKDEDFGDVHGKLEQHRKAIPSAKVEIGGKEFEIGGKQVRIPGRLLTAEDELFKAIASRQELNVLAYRQAMKEGLSEKSPEFSSRVAQILKDTPEDMMKQAKDFADYQTFTKELGPMGQAVQKFANSHPLVRFFIPFIRTPANILKYAGERTPFGLLSKEIRENLSGANGEVIRDTQLARMVLGSSIGITFGTMAALGQITGGGPKDTKEKALLYQTGWQPYSVKIGDMYYSYQWLEPFATIMGISADAVELSEHMDEKEIEKIPSMIMASISKNLVNKTWLQGPSDLIQAIDDPERYGTRYIQNFVSSLVPNVLAQTARTIDPVMHETRSMLDAIKARVPGMSSDLFPRRDVWGNPVTYEGGAGPDILSPIYESSIVNDPVNQKLAELKIYPSRPDRKIRGVELTDEQYDKYVMLSGQMSKQNLDAMIKFDAAGLSALPVEDQEKIITKTIKDSREQARNTIMMMYPDIMTKALDAKIFPVKK